MNPALSKDIVLGLGSVILWQAELVYSRILMLSWFGGHCGCCLFVWGMGSGYFFIDWFGIILIVWIMFKSKQRRLIQSTGRLLWYKCSAGHYIYYKGQHCKLRGAPRRFYYLIIFEIAKRDKLGKATPLLLIAQDSLPHKQWRQLTSVVAYQQILHQVKRS